jgi:ketosteroid isomerase-like protein
LIPLTYHAIVRRRIVRVFELISNDEWDAVLRDVREDVHHSFSGDHPLGGERHSRASLALWAERLGRLFPVHEFEVQQVIASGGPHNTWVNVRWSARLVPLEGPTYHNEGTHWMQLRWGKLTELHAYLDTQLVARACEAMVAAGVEEAGAPPIE